MVTKHFINVILGFTIISCSSKENTSNVSDQISGVYAREYSFRVTNPESGGEIGMSTIRDTIFIRPVENGYEVSNNKWKMNDYDKDGWKNMEHSDDRPMPTFQTKFDSSQSTLISKAYPSLHFNKKTSRLFKNHDENNSYQKMGQ